MADDKLQEYMNKAAAIILVMCVFAALSILVIFTVGKVFINPIEPVNITYTFQTDTTGVITPESQHLADSVLHEMSRYEHRIADKYEYVIDQQSNVADYLTWGGILITIVVSVFGFFGYKSLQSIEERIIAVVEPQASSKASAKAEEVAEKKAKTFSDTAKEGLEEAKKNIEEKIDLKVQNSVSRIKSELKEESYKNASEAVKEELNRTISDQLSNIEGNTSSIEELQLQNSAIKDKVLDMEYKIHIIEKRMFSKPATPSK